MPNHEDLIEKDSSNLGENNTKVIVIGLDGATFDVIDPLIEQGHLPNLKFIKENGAYGILKSTFPPITGPAWLSMATGKNPGQTGVFDFLIKDEDGYKQRFITSKDYIANRTYWDYASSAGMQVAIINYPTLYPPYEINGVMIGGLGTSSQQRITYPPELQDELDRLVRGYEVSVLWNHPKYHNHLELLVSDLKRVLNKRIEVNKYLLKKEAWDLFITVFSASDFMQHCMWQFWAQDFHSQFRHEFIEIWERLDEGLGEILALAPTNAHIFVVSDHGFGELKGSFLINKWLEKQGWLVRKSGWQDIKAHAISNTVLFLRELLRKTNLTKSAMRRQFTRVQTDPIFRLVDMTKTKAISGGRHSSTYGAIYIQNYENEVEYENIRDNIINSLELKASSEFHLNIKCFRREDLYSGENLNLAPDILLKVNNWSCHIKTNTLDGEIFQPPNGKEHHTGSHRQEGIFIYKGPHTNRGELEGNLKIEDICPTILHLLGFPLPADVDGKVRTELFTVSLKENPKLGQGELKLATTSEESTQTEEELEKVMERLKDLGYLE